MMVLVQLTATQPQARLLLRSDLIQCEVLQTHTATAGNKPRIRAEMNVLDMEGDVDQTFVCSWEPEKEVQIFAALPVHAITKQYLGLLHQKKFRELRLRAEQLPLHEGDCITVLITIDETNGSVLDNKKE